MKFPATPPPLISLIGEDTHFLDMTYLSEKKHVTVKYIHIISHKTSQSLTKSRNRHSNRQS